MGEEGSTAGGRGSTSTGLRGQVVDTSQERLVTSWLKRSCLLEGDK